MSCSGAGASGLLSYANLVVTAKTGQSLTRADAEKVFHEKSGEYAHLVKTGQVPGDRPSLAHTLQFLQERAREIQNDPHIPPQRRDAIIDNFRRKAAAIRAEMAQRDAGTWTRRATEAPTASMWLAWQNLASDLLAHVRTHRCPDCQQFVSQVRPHQCPTVGKADPSAGEASPAPSLRDLMATPPPVASAPEPDPGEPDGYLDGYDDGYAAGLDDTRYDDTRYDGSAFDDAVDEPGYDDSLADDPVRPFPAPPSTAAASVPATNPGPAARPPVTATAPPAAPRPAYPIAGTTPAPAGADPAPATPRMSAKQIAGIAVAAVLVPTPILLAVIVAYYLGRNRVGGRRVAARVADGRQVAQQMSPMSPPPTQPRPDTAVQPTAAGHVPAQSRATRLPVPVRPTRRPWRARAADALSAADARAQANLGAHAAPRGPSWRARLAGWLSGAHPREIAPDPADRAAASTERAARVHLRLNGDPVGVGDRPDGVTGSAGPGEVPTVAAPVTARLAA